MEGDIIAMQEIFTFRQTGVAANGVVEGPFPPPACGRVSADRLRSHGVLLAPSLFAPGQPEAA